jgi:hypothetical protein
MSRGAITKRSGKVIAGPGGGSLVPPGASVLGQTLFADRDADITIGAGTTADLVSIAIVLTAARTVQIWSESAMTEAALGQGFYFLQIDGVTVVSNELGAANPAAFVVRSALNWQAVLAAGAHTIRTRGQAVGAALFCRGATQRAIENATLTVNEIITP